MPVPVDRLTAADLYDYVKRAEDAFADGDDEIEVVRGGRLQLVTTLDERIRQLIGVIPPMREPHHAEAMELIDQLKRARISQSVDLPKVFGELRSVISAWNAARQSRRQAA